MGGVGDEQLRRGKSDEGKKGRERGGGENENRMTRGRERGKRVRKEEGMVKRQTTDPANDYLHVIQTIIARRSKKVKYSLGTQCLVLIPAV